MGKKVELPEALSVEAALRLTRASQLGVIDVEFLSQPLSVIDPPAPVCARERSSLGEVLTLLRTHRIGCVIIVGETGEVRGIFSERDYVLKVQDPTTALHQPISSLMTPEPVCEQMTCSIAFALNLMSNGGFRHLPIVDGDRMPVGLVSVKDLIDALVERFDKDLLRFEEGVGDQPG